MGNLCKKPKINKGKGIKEDDYKPKNVYSCCKDGHKKSGDAGQDVHHVFGFEEDNTQIKFLGVYDGHGSHGKEASSKVAKMIEEYILKNKLKLSKFTTRDDVTKNFESLFETIQKELSKEKDTTYEKSGTCAICVLIVEKHFYCINIGDSRAVIGARSSDSLFAIQMSMDHKPLEKAELNRIFKSGGEVQQKNGALSPARICRNSENSPGLAVSRSFGDFIAHEVGVIETPQVSYKILDDKDEFVVMGSDGVFDVMSSLEVVGYAFEKLQEGVSKETIVKNLVDECRNRWFILHKYKESKENMLIEKNLNKEDENIKDEDDGVVEEKKEKLPVNDNVPILDNDIFPKEIIVPENFEMALINTNAHIDDITIIMCFFKEKI